MESKALWRAYLELCKPRVVALMLLTAWVGMQLATPHAVAFSTLLSGILGIALVAAAAAVMNQLIDQRIDAQMQRTMQRPIPSGQISKQNALFFAGLLASLGMLILLLFINPLTAGLTFLTFIGYAGIYTLYLKRATPQNIVIGGAAGAAPPMLGWTAVTNHIDPFSLLLVLIIFVWTPPHFWALAIHRYTEYAKVNIPMLPVTHGIPFTKRCILLYTVLLTAISVLPYAYGMSSILYGMGALGLDAGFLYWAWVLWQGKRPEAAIKTFRYSIVYLMSLFVLLLFDHALFNGY